MVSWASAAKECLLASFCTKNLFGFSKTSATYVTQCQIKLLERPGAYCLSVRFSQF